MSALKNEMSCSESLAIESAVITAESIVVQIGAVFTPLWMYLSACYIHYSSVWNEGVYIIQERPPIGINAKSGQPMNAI